jgi:hypothetical protein
MRWPLGFPYFLKDLVRLQLDTGPGMYQEEEYIWLLLFPKPPAGEARGKILEARVAARQPRPRHNIFHDDSGQTEKNTFSNHYPLLILYKGHLHGLS